MSGGVPAGDIAFLNDLAARLFKYATPMKGFDQGDTDRLYRIARDLAPTPTPPIEGRDADVERVEKVAKAMYDATHAGLSNCYAWDDEWEPYQEAGRGRYYKEAAAAIAALQALGERG